MMSTWCSKHVEKWNKTYCKTKILCINLDNYWDKYTEMQGQQNDKYTEIHSQQNDKYTEMHGQQNVRILCNIASSIQINGLSILKGWNLRQQNCETSDHYYCYYYYFLWITY